MTKEEIIQEIKDRKGHCEDELRSLDLWFKNHPEQREDVHLKGLYEGYYKQIHWLKVFIAEIGEG